MSARRPLRLFLDSNVLTGGMVSDWGLDKAVLSLCAARVARLVLAEVVRLEVEQNLLEHAERMEKARAARLLADYGALLSLARPEVVPPPPAAEVASSRHLIRHAADVPVLLSAISCRPDWLLTRNTGHFTETVARRTGLRIATPNEFFRVIAERVEP